MPNVTCFLPWPTLSVAPLPPTLVLTPVLLKFILTPGRTLKVLRKRKYPMALGPLIHRPGRPPRAPDWSAPFDHYSQRFATSRSDAPGSVNGSERANRWSVSDFRDLDGGHSPHVCLRGTIFHRFFPFFASST